MNWFRKKSPKIVAESVSWTPRHVSELRSFLNTQTGKDFIRLCGFHAMQEAMAECEGERAVKIAAGMNSLLRFQFNLASEKTLEQVSGREPAKSQETDPADENASGILSRAF